jgi:hypothetical protein
MSGQVEHAQQQRPASTLPHDRVFKARPPRTRTCLKGKLVHDGGAFTIDCAIHDISDGGAKVILEKRQALPSELYLIVVKHGVAYRAKVVWQKFPARGLMFVEPYALAAVLPDSVKFLHRLWIDLCARPGVA